MPDNHLAARYSPDVFAMTQHAEAERDHIPAFAVAVLHCVECVRHVRVTVITAQVVL